MTKTELITSAVAFGSLCATGLLLRRVLRLEKHLSEVEAKFELTSEQQRSVIEWLTQRVGNIASAPASPMLSRAQVQARDNVSEVSDSNRSDVGGYKTAEEEEDEGAEATPPSEASSRSRKVPLERAVAVSVPTESFEGTVSMPASADSPVMLGREPEWGAQSVYIGEHAASWSCVSQVASSAGGGSTSASSGAAAAAAAAEAAEARAVAIKAVLERADAMYEAGEYEAATELLKAQEPSQVDVLWRRCRLLKSFADVAKDRGDVKEAERSLREGLQYVSQALQRDESNWAVHKWYAITVSLTSAFDGTKAAIKQSFVVKEHFLRAAELNPHDATTRHALGCWYWEVASLSWAMRKVAAAVFASPPTGTFDEALAHFSLAESLSPGFYIRNRLMLARCQQQLRDKVAAKRWAAQALELPVNNIDDEGAVAEAKALLASI